MPMGRGRSSRPDDSALTRQVGQRLAEPSARLLDLLVAESGADPKLAPGAVVDPVVDRGEMQQTRGLPVDLTVTRVEHIETKGRADALDANRHAVLLRGALQARAQPLRQPVDSVDLSAGQIAHGDLPRDATEQVAVEGATVVQRALVGEVERLQQLALRGDRADWQAAANPLAQTGDVGSADAEALARAAHGQARHQAVIEDVEDALATGEPA